MKNTAAGTKRSEISVTSTHGNEVTISQMVIPRSIQPGQTLAE
jgi:hypothetical protein